MNQTKTVLKNIPVAGLVLKRLYQSFQGLHRFDSKSYWKARYHEGGNSGSGSYGRLAQFKAEVLNKFVHEHDIQSVIEFGCGDGNQLSLARYPGYVGFDPAPEAIQRCRQRFANDARMTFHLLDGEYMPGKYRAQLVLSLDVIYHLVEDSVFELHMRSLFDAAERYVIIYSDDAERPSAARHVRHRRFSDWIATHAQGWKLIEQIANTYPYQEDDPDSSWAAFWVYALA